MPAVLYEKRDNTAWVTLNRPEAKNMMNAEVFGGLLDAWQEIRDDRDVRVVILTAAGDVDFCVGGDLRELIPLWTKAKQPETELERRVADPRILDRVMLKTEPLDKPIIGAINGRALGGGTEILLLTDIRIAVEHATFGLPEPRAGIVPGAGAMARLARQIPYAHAMKLMLTAEPITAAEALTYGLISEVVPPSGSWPGPKSWPLWSVGTPPCRWGWSSEPFSPPTPWTGRTPSASRPANRRLRPGAKTPGKGR